MNDIQNKDYWATRSKSDMKMDWNPDAEDWVSDYKNSVEHPHRNALIKILAHLKPKSLFEVGASCGPNLAKIHKAFPDMELSGVDASPLAVDQAIFDGWSIAQGDVLRIPFHDKVDIVLSDACLMYVSPKDIKQAMDEINRIAKNYVILFEWHDESLLGVVKDYHLARDYKTILEWYGFEVETKKITKDIWPTSNSWLKNGYIYVATKNTNQQ